MIFQIYYQKDSKLHHIALDVENKKDLKHHNNYPQNIIFIKENRRYNFDITIFTNYKKDIFQMFSQLNMMLSSSLDFSTAIELLLNVKQEKYIEDILYSIQKSIKTSQKIEIALEKHKDYLGETSLLFLKLGFENGNIKDSIQSLVEILKEDIESKNKLIDVMRYPIILILSLMIAVAMIFIYVLPNFDFIFTMLGDNIPLATQSLLWIRDAIGHYGIFVLFSFIFLVMITMLIYEKYRLWFDKVTLKNIPILSKVIKNYYFYRLFLSISVIIKSKYQFQLAVLNSKNIVNNLYIQSSMDKILNNIKNGSSIAKSFSDSKLFDPLIIKLLYTAEYTNKYEIVLNEITQGCKEQFNNSLKNFSSIIEPTMILMMSLIVLWLILAIMLPIWDLGTVINK